jgi:MYXO-CTERM domain-containing protein
LNRASIAARRFLLVVCQLAVILLCTSSAFAGGRVEWKTTAVKERDDKSWRLEVAIYMPKAPDVPHVSMKFEFQPVAYYARDMTDGDKLVEHTVPLSDHQSLIESVDVGFMDSGSGKIESRTRFTFKVTRAHGYEAGEYKVTIKDTRNGQTVGTSQTLKFQGENEVIDRRAMVFSGGDKKKKEDVKKVDGDAGGDKPAGDDSAKKKDDAGGDDAAKKDDAPAADDAKPAPSEDAASGDDKAPPPVEGKPGGCGCKLAGGEHGNLASALALLGVATLVARRRRAA